MQYKLTWKDLIKGIFRGGNVFITGIFITLFILPLLVSLLYIPELFFLIGMLAVIVPLCIFVVSTFNSGWSIENEIFHLKSFSDMKKIKVSSMEIGMVKNNGVWQPSTRIFGIGLPGLLMGDCRLRNKETALVFLYLNVENVLLIFTDGKYYLIGHPGIENLYNELIRLGAKQKDFE